MQPNEIKNLICEQLDDYKAMDITVLAVEHLTVLADYFVIATGRSQNNVRALGENLMDKMEEKGVFAIRNDGIREGKWAVVDFGSVIVHIFNDDTRMFYCLEKLWADADSQNIQKYPE